ncbi:site-specific integrase [Micromonospora coerulea]|uniref:site-specific integrase n=1 Tax=Micromonospora coerulea TaxID=47856 RepID=UPI001903D0FB|nr:site-specific integrase [Micromonospora veneta]
MNEIEIRGSNPNGLANPRQFVLSESALDRLRRAKADSTLRAYRGDLRRMLVWAGAEKMIPADLTPTDRGPINDALNAAAFAALLERYGQLHTMAAEYVNHLAEEGKAPSTIDRALAAVAVAHRSAGAGRLATDAARAVLRTYRRDSADDGRKVRKAKPLLVSNLRLMVDTLDLDRLAGLRNRSVLVLGFALGARRSEIAALDIEDLDFNEHGLEVTIRRSKTDKDATGRKVHVPYGTNEQTCPVRTTRAWLAALGQRGVAGGALYRRIDKHGELGRAPHGRGSADGRITGQAVAIIIQRTALAAGLDAASTFSGHSLRRGFATEARRAGHDQIRIGRHGGWKDGSPTLAGYMEDVDRVTSNALTGVGL